MVIKSDQDDPKTLSLHAAYFDLARALLVLEREKITLDDVRDAKTICGAAIGKLMELDRLMAEERER